MRLVYDLHLHEPGQWGKSRKPQAEQQQLEVDLTMLPHGASSTFQDFKVYLESLGYKSPSFVTCIAPMLGPLALSPYEISCKDRFFLTSDGSIYRDWGLYDYATKDDTKVQPYAECTAAATAAAAAAGSGGASQCQVPFLKVSATRGTKPLPLKVCVKSMWGKTFTLTAHEVTTIQELKMMLGGFSHKHQRLSYNDRQCRDGETLGEVAASSNIPLDRFEPTFELTSHIRAGMFHSSSGREDQENLSEDGLEFSKVTVLTSTGAVLELSVPTAFGPGGYDFRGAQLAGLAQKALEQQAQPQPRRSARLSGRQSGLQA